MVKFYESIPPNLSKWIQAQEMFWVASAPAGPSGHVNVSPKGVRDTFRIEGPNKVWYEDFTGSGSETMAHLRENGRITIMFCAFEGAPRILRLWGTGYVHEFGTPEYDAIIPPTKRRPGSRCVVVIDVKRVGTSCGTGVPHYTFVRQRPTMLDWCARLEVADQTFDAEAPSDPDSERVVSEKGMKAWWTKENSESLDGLPAMKSAHQTYLTPEHAPPNGEWGKNAKNRLEVINAQKKVKSTPSGYAELIRLLSAFTMGLAVATAYVKVTFAV
ncbi:uncharacterized protein FIBRA_01995 [Fibroporia radiculosa]|uniref:Pyridoxamine 5'-phosphate oxidase N-terminal domain-containing protein n=1 Tax=Fibroporia radiculosa TaxID=599839 RepID=J4GM27_9APHY|nr:uncharacterized protein FIBRA_01995 [Fibroporia radiculosa]CCL99970.1 predicted protein [Fibroporia radiculosa]